MRFKLQRRRLCPQTHDVHLYLVRNDLGHSNRGTGYLVKEETEHISLRWLVLEDCLRKSGLSCSGGRPSLRFGESV